MIMKDVISSDKQRLNTVPNASPKCQTPSERTRLNRHVRFSDCSLCSFVCAHCFLTFFDLIYQDVRVNIRRWRKTVKFARTTIIFSGCALLFGLTRNGVILYAFKATCALVNTGLTPWCLSVQMEFDTNSTTWQLALPVYLYRWRVDRVTSKSDVVTSFKNLGPPYTGLPFFKPSNYTEFRQDGRGEVFWQSVFTAYRNSWIT